MMNKSPKQPANPSVTFSHPVISLQFSPNSSFYLMPKLASIAPPALALLATSCGMQQSFSSLKWVKDERQRNVLGFLILLLHCSISNGVLPTWGKYDNESVVLLLCLCVQGQRQ